MPTSRPTRSTSASGRAFAGRRRSGVDHKRRRKLPPRIRALVVAVALAALSCASPAGARVKGGDHANALLHGIPQHGTGLGRHSARVTMLEFADLQCPFCRDYHRQVFPTLVRRYVRTGKIRMRYVPLAFIGRDSVRAGKAAIAAGTENRLWNFVSVFFANQRIENTGYATDRFLRRVGRAARVSRRTIDARNHAHEEARLRWAERLARRLHVDSTPTFFLVRRGHKPHELRYRDFSRRSFTRPIDRALKR